MYHLLSQKGTLVPLTLGGSTMAMMTFKAIVLKMLISCMPQRHWEFYNPKFGKILCKTKITRKSEQMPCLWCLPEKVMLLELDVQWVALYHYKYRIKPWHIIRLVNFLFLREILRNLSSRCWRISLLLSETLENSRNLVFSLQCLGSGLLLACYFLWFKSDLVFYFSLAIPANVMSPSFTLLTNI